MILLDAIYKLNSHCAADSSLWEKLQIKRCGRAITKIAANCLLPIAFDFSKGKNAKLADADSSIIVSLTSFPARIGRVWMTIESMIRQQKKPKEIVLWLSRKQFPNEMNELPSKLIEQTQRGLTIRFVDDDIRSFKKFYYAFQEYKDDLIVTIDDDLLFPSYFLKQMYECKLSHPNDIIASFGFRFKWNPQIEYIEHIPNCAKRGDSGTDLFYGSGGGTLFEPARLVGNMDEWETIHELTPTADDIYLNALTRISGYGVTFHQNDPLLSIVNFRDSKLVSHNGDIGDQKSVNATQLKALVKYLETKQYNNPFNDNGSK